MSIEVLSEVAEQIKGQTVVCVASGGNFDFERLPEVKERAQRYTGRKKYFILRLPQRPGALKDFLNILGPDDNIARFEYLKKSARNFGSVLSCLTQAWSSVETLVINFALDKSKQATMAVRSTKSAFPAAAIFSPLRHL